ncbi:MAG TPA: NAD(P)/FAD-dependent oxidoreductase [Methanobacterium sp.]|jgi:digeranylgeranylglycerophospholipid reductase|nr:MAG: NAD(P)/FAD-dependent oxidoreductase [Methanobacterium sp.]HOI71747.1 NAD(P)/FAD-dependent oxidoreductase [Methanobacterium sp.]
MKYDVVVVGGRIGGSIASLYASKDDADVLMIEKRQEIGTPVQCAEGTTQSIFKILDMKPDKRYINAEIDGATIHAPDGRAIDLAEVSCENFLDGTGYKGYILDRKVFDKHLAIQAAKAGAEIMMKTTVKDLIRKDGRVCGVVAEHLGETMEIKADVVIAADGVESNMARQAGLTNPNKPGNIGSCAQYELFGLDIDPHQLNFYFGREIAPGGYLWMFPKGEDTVNVGLGVRSTKKTAYQYLNQFISRFKGTTPVELNIGGVPLSGPIDKTYTDGLLVVGDAAGHVDPVTGGGIHIAAFCGKTAGQVAAEAVKKENTSESVLKRYDEIWREKFGKNLEISLKYRNAADKLTDKDMNALAEFLEKNKIENLSKISAIKFLGKHPHLLMLIRDLL